MEEVSLPAIDIISIDTTASEGILHIYMYLATNYTEEAKYLVTLFIDETFESTFGWDRTQGFYWWDGRYLSMTVNGSFSESGESLHWEASIKQLNATESVRILHGDAKFMVGYYARWQDLVWAIVVPAQGPVSADIEYTVLTSLDLVKRVTIRLDEFDATDLREVIDVDSDLRVTQSEVDYYIATFLSNDLYWDWTWVTQNGVRAIRADRDLELLGATGPVYSTDPITKVLTRTIVFPLQGDWSRMTYAWTYEFITEEGVVPWDVSKDSNFTFSVLPDHEPTDYDRTLSDQNMSSIMTTYFTEDLKAYHMTGSEMRADWNDTLGDKMGFVLLRDPISSDPIDKPSDRPSDDSCCSSAMVVIVVLPCVTVVGWRGRRSKPIDRTPPQ